MEKSDGEAMDSSVSNSEDTLLHGIHKKRLFYASLFTASCIGGFAAYGYYNWWGGVPAEFTWAEEGNMEQTSYTGGADKFGHMFGAYLICRSMTDVYRWTGFTKNTSLVISSCITQFLFTATELEDAFFDIGFSVHDLIFNIAGNGLAVFSEKYSLFDDLVDFRIEYFPTKSQRDIFPENLNFAEDYSGQRFLFVFKFSGIKKLNKKPIKYLELNSGYYTYGYKPPLYLNGFKLDFLRRRDVFFGFSVNIPWILKNTAFKGDRFNRIEKISSGFLEYYQIPYTAPMIVDYALPKE
jgi:hypothetical protein